ncbi:GspH/FimT family pseudopilin [Geobacter grbiciae]|uniref:GspH/FimT family pseudopilin n=1 Tax=Geobacter grbiciae TaxID=155042 RepID=UPI001C011CF0|nr:GspH/FimT family pseudopilin [Geobacter grbiciae]MBT1076602.1 GspH/FimT family pseudopilin [Geobacter grbiciae]
MISKAHNNRGFSLIELIVAVAIIGILAGVGTVMYLRELPLYRLKDATRLLFSDIQSARIYALRNGAPCTLEQFPTNGNGYRIVQNGTVLKTIDLGGFTGVSFGSLNADAPAPDSGTFTSNQLVIQPSGIASTGNFYLRDNRNPADGRRIAVNAAGRPIISSWDSSTSTYK